METLKLCMTNVNKGYTCAKYKMHLADFIRAA